MMLFGDPYESPVISESCYKGTILQRNTCSYFPLIPL